MCISNFQLWIHIISSQVFGNFISPKANVNIKNLGTSKEMIYLHKRIISYMPKTGKYVFSLWAET